MKVNGQREATMIRVYIKVSIWNRNDCITNSFNKEIRFIALIAIHHYVICHTGSNIYCNPKIGCAESTGTRDSSHRTASAGINFHNKPWSSKRTKINGNGSIRNGSEGEPNTLIGSINITAIQMWIIRIECSTIG